MPSNSTVYGIEAFISVNERLVASVTNGLGGHTIVATQHSAEWLSRNLSDIPIFYLMASPHRSHTQRQQAMCTLYASRWCDSPFRGGSKSESKGQNWSTFNFQHARDQIKAASRRRLCMTQRQFVIIWRSCTGAKNPLHTDM